MLSFLGLGRRSTLSGDAEAMMDAFSRSQGIISFALDGTILDANQNFLDLMEYDRADVLGRPHSIFVDQRYAKSEQYARFWADLASGSAKVAEFKRFGRGGKEVWIQACYNPILNDKGVPYKIVKIATDITDQKRQAADAKGQVVAISKAQAVIEFSLDGVILTANSNFCSTMGYRLDEIVGRHHRIFVDPAYADSSEYRQFWTSLKRGSYQTDEYRRIGKGGKEVWIQASYNPILDPDGTPYKVVKFATDVSARKKAINTLGASLGRLAEGDLSAGIRDSFAGDLDVLRVKFNHAISHFAKTISKVRNSSASLKAATGEILLGSNDLAARTTHQAAMIEKTSTAVAQLTNTVSANAGRAEEAQTRTQAIAAAASLTGSTMLEVSQAMDRISASSTKITNIMGLIDDIAFQTNLLALNASVEAARAGDAGKGFAVVAVEVRRLAQSAATASGEIKGLVDVSAKEVSGGSHMVTSAVEQVARVVAGIHESNALVQEIASASRDQSSAIASVRDAIHAMEEMTQHNAALVEQTNAAIEQTESQSNELDFAIDVFTVPARHDRAA